MLGRILDLNVMKTKAVQREYIKICCGVLKSGGQVQRLAEFQKTNTFEVCELIRPTRMTNPKSA